MIGLSSSIFSKLFQKKVTKSKDSRNIKIDNNKFLSPLNKENNSKYSNIRKQYKGSFYENKFKQITNKNNSKNDTILLSKCRNSPDLKSLNVLSEIRNSKIDHIIGNQNNNLMNTINKKFKCSINPIKIKRKLQEEKFYWFATYGKYSKIANFENIISNCIDNSKFSENRPACIKGFCLTFKKVENSFFSINLEKQSDSILIMNLYLIKKNQLPNILYIISNENSENKKYQKQVDKNNFDLRNLGSLEGIKIYTLSYIISHYIDFLKEYTNSILELFPSILGTSIFGNVITCTNLNQILSEEEIKEIILNIMQSFSDFDRLQNIMMQNNTKEETNESTKIEINSKDLLKIVIPKEFCNLWKSKDQFFIESLKDEDYEYTQLNSSIEEVLNDLGKSVKNIDSQGSHFDLFCEEKLQIQKY